MSPTQSLRWPRSAARASLAAIAGLGLATFVAPARADDFKACSAAQARAQQHRDKGKPLAARLELSKCAATSCAATAKACAEALAELDDALPSIRVTVVDASGAPAADGTITIDGEPTPKAADGAFPAEPGDHAIGCAVGDARGSVRVTLTSDDHGKKATCTLPAPRVAPPPVAPEAASSPPPGNWMRTASYVVGGVGLAGLIVGNVITIKSMADRQALIDDCYPSCKRADVSSIETAFVAGDVALGVGIGGMALATVLRILSNGAARPAGSEAHAAITVAPRGNGGEIVIRTGF